MTAIRIGTRKSNLAMEQTNLVADAIRTLHPEFTIEIVSMSTKGDERLDLPLLSLGGKGVFISEFEEALRDGTIDLAVHSAKDLPMSIPGGLEIAAAGRREDPRDAIVFPKGKTVGREGKIRIGTSSLRRQIQIKGIYKNAQVNPIRGNVNTRLRKMMEGEFDGLVLAMAGLKRLHILPREEYEIFPFPVTEFVPAGGQGIIAVEGRKGEFLAKQLKDITHTDTMHCLKAEREVLRLLGAGCNEPFGVHGAVTGRELNLSLMSEARGRITVSTVTGSVYDWKELAAKVVAG